MNKILEYLKSRNIAYYIALSSTVCGFIALIVYCAAGTNSFAPNLSPTVIVPLILGILIGAFSAVRTFKLVLLAGYIAYFYGFLSHFIVNLNLIANLAYNVDGSSFPVSFFVIVVISFLAVGGMLTAGIMTKYGRGSQRSVKEEA